MDEITVGKKLVEGHQAFKDVEIHADKGHHRTPAGSESPNPEATDQGSPSSDDPQGDDPEKPAPTKGDDPQGGDPQGDDPEKSGCLAKNMIVATLMAMSMSILF